jgi:hypothetical protein
MNEAIRSQLKGIISAFLWKSEGKSQQVLVSISDGQIEIRTAHPLHIPIRLIQKNLFGVKILLPFIMNVIVM